jgi:hypothetical protein
LTRYLHYQLLIPSFNRGTVVNLPYSGSFAVSNVKPQLMNVANNSEKWSKRSGVDLSISTTNVRFIDVWRETFVAWNDPLQELTAFYIFNTFTFSTFTKLLILVEGEMIQLTKSMKRRIPLLSLAIWQIDLKDMSLLHQSMIWVITMLNKYLNSNSTGADRALSSNWGANRVIK